MARPPGPAGRRAGGTGRSAVVVRPSWRISPVAVRLAAIGAIGLLAAVVLGRAELVLLAAPCVGALAVAARARRPAELRVDVAVEPRRCFEGDAVAVHARVRAAAPLGEVSVGCAPTARLAVDGVRRHTAYFRHGVAGGFTVRPVRWGRWTAPPLTVWVRTVGLGYVGESRLGIGELVVFPDVRRIRDIAVPPRLLARFGSHVGRRPGAGVEFAGIRPYVPGDVVRRINWAVSSRRGALYVTERAGERAVDVVAIVDTTVDLGPFGTSSLDRSVRGAAEVCQAYLGYVDRVGVVGFGGMVRWLAPGAGARQLYRIVETLLATRCDATFVEPDLARVPRQALPSGALVYVFTPLLTERVVETVRDLRERGFPVVVVDVLGVEPDPGSDAVARLALRLWRLEREGLRTGLRDIGAVVVGWDDDHGAPLEQVVLGPLLGGRR